jgi:hypothetical protein
VGLLHDLKTKRFWRYFVVGALACGGAFSAVLQFVNLIFPDVIFYRGAWSLLVMTTISLLVGLVRAWPRPIEEHYSRPKTCIHIVEGNLLEQDSHLVIGTCDTFDTATPVIIARDSLQGQVLDVLFGGNVDQLDDLLSQALKGKSVTGVINKNGKQNKYEIGTVATIHHGPRLLFFSAYCEMDKQNNTGTTIDNVWKSLLSLWTEISMRGNGSPVSISVLGGGLARISDVLPAQDSIRLIALSFMFASRRATICDELRIVVRPKEYQHLDRLELQSFLSSLRPS